MRTSVGLTFYEYRDRENREESWQKLADRLIREADAAMRAAKRTRRRTSVRTFDSRSMNRIERTVLSREKELSEAIEDGQVVPFYQPLVDLRSRKVTGVEVLARWLHPDRGLIPPAEFMPLAEDSGLVVPLGRSVISRAVTELESSMVEPEGFVVSANLSPQELRDPELVPFVEDLIRGTPFSPESLQMEITEGEAVENPVTIERLRELDVNVVLDDFGTGYASLGYLEELAVSGVKVDRTFVAGINRQLSSEALLEAILMYCDRVGLSLVAEGIEREGQVPRLLEMGVTTGQGFFFSPAVPLDELRALP